MVACSSSPGSMRTLNKPDSVQAVAKTDRASAVEVPEDYTVEVVAGADLVDYPMFGTVDENGRLFLFESTGDVYEKTEDAIRNPQFRINLLEDLNGDGVYDKSTIFADKIGFPQGGVFYKGSLYASSAPDLLKLTDTDGDGVADKREVLLSGWVLNVNANSLVGPFMGPDGWLYMTSAIMGFDVTTREGQRLKGGTARIWRVRPDGSGLEWISAGGMNNPVELTFTEAAEPIGTETYFTEPKAGQRDALVYWTEGGVYPKPNHNILHDSLVLTGELMPVVSKYSRVSPAGICRYRGTSLGEGFKDNLFSAQFNTHRILRHRLFREGASFRTEDEVFFASKDEDFHPTDVLEDGEGSLLVVETGGWFIKGCPLSQVSKPELQGAIYRVRRKGVAKVDDPYGKAIGWSALSPDKVVAYLEDARPTVRDRAAQWLVDQGPGAVQALTVGLSQLPSADARVKAVFALYRIGTEEALAAVRAGLSDTDAQVRVAAARSVGLARDKRAVGKLLELVRQQEPAVRRQAATALGQIGEKEAIPALLAVADKTKDRFIRHAITYALIAMNQAKMVEPGLIHASPQVRETALIALDQMRPSTLRPDQLRPFLTSKSLDIQRTALWVASHHPHWADEMTQFLRSRFAGSPFTEEEKEMYGNVITSFGENTSMQRFVADQLKGVPLERKLFLLDAMAKSRVKKFPEIWVEAIGRQLTSANDRQVQARTMELIRLRGITSLNDRLRQVAEDPKSPASLRIEVIGALTKDQPQFSDAHFNYLYDRLKAGEEAPVRQQAATILAQGKLSEPQLLRLATEYLPRADAFVLPGLVPVFAGAHSVTVGQALANTLRDSPSLDNFSEENLRAVFAEYPEEVKPAVEGLMTKLREVRADRIKRLSALEQQIGKGDLERGRQLFYGKAICSTCHKVGSEGGKLGPDLTSIQRDRSAHDLLEAIVYPSVSFVREYETYRVKTRKDTYTGVIQQQTTEALILGTAPQASVRIPRNEIVSTERVNLSMMPQGLDGLLSAQEMADLMAFLLGQDQDPETDQKILR